MAVRTVDLNADLGEGMGDDGAMLDLVSSANVACGGHAGDVETMYRTMAAAAARGVVVGAHPGYADREHFGRRDLAMDPDAIGRMVVAQVGSLRAVATQVPVAVRYVKLHGALANLAARSSDVAEAVVRAVTAMDPQLPLLAISGTELELVARRRGHPVFSEIYADRAYLADGRLVPRSRDGAVLHDVDEVADRVVGALESGTMPTIDGRRIPLAADSVCVHGDTPGAVAMATRLVAQLRASQTGISGFVAP